MKEQEIGLWSTFKAEISALGSVNRRRPKKYQNSHMVLLFLFIYFLLVKHVIVATASAWR